MRILLIEHHDLTRGYIGLCLTEEGHEVIEVATMNAAVSRLTEELVAEFLIADFNLEASLDGIDIADRFKAINRHGKVLVTSADPIRARQKLARRGAGFAEFLAKPFFKADLLSAVERARQMSSKS